MKPSDALTLPSESITSAHYNGLAPSFGDERKDSTAVLMHGYRGKISEYILLTIIYSQQDIFRYTPKYVRRAHSMRHQAPDISNIARMAEFG